MGCGHRLQASRPKAAFYAFFAVDGMNDSVAAAKDVIDRVNVGLAPGSAFGPSGEGYLRLCFAASEDTLIRGLDALEGIFGEGSRQ
jgi:aspartate aminotransferase